VHFLNSDALSHTLCIVTDVEMSQMSGLGLLQHVKTSCDGVHVIIMTGKPSENSETLYFNRDGFGFRKAYRRGHSLAILDSISSGSENQVIYRG
jgi:CheY-like chemotaxis protein